MRLVGLAESPAVTGDTNPPQRCRARVRIVKRADGMNYCAEDWWWENVPVEWKTVTGKV